MVTLIRVELLDDKLPDTLISFRRSRHSRVRDLAWYLSYRLGRLDAAGLLGIAWFALIVGCAPTVGVVIAWTRLGSALQLSASDLVGFVLIWSGGLLLVLSLRGLGGLTSRSVHALVAAGLAIILMTDAPWTAGAAITTSRSSLSAIHRTCVEAAHISLAIDSCMVLILALAGLLLLFLQSQGRVAVTRSLVSGSAAAVMQVCVAAGWPSSWGGVHTWEVGAIAVLAAAVYVAATGRRSPAATLSPAEVIQLRDVRERRQGKGNVP